MIVIDAETTGLSPTKNSIVSLGAVDYDTGDEFYGECRIAPGTTIDDAALKVNGFTREQVTDETKDLPTVLYVKFLQWAVGREMLLGGQQVGSFDIPFIKHLHDSLDFDFKADLGDKTKEWTGKLKWPFSYRSVDLHSVAYAQLGKSLFLDGILTAVGLSAEEKPHNALTGARLERDAFKRLLGVKIPVGQLYGQGPYTGERGWKS